MLPALPVELPDSAGRRGPDDAVAILDEVEHGPGELGLDGIVRHSTVAEKAEAAEAIADPEPPRGGGEHGEDGVREKPGSGLRPEQLEPHAVEAVEADRRSEPQ